MAGGHILVIDDDPQVRALLRRVLVADGFSVELAEAAPPSLSSSPTHRRRRDRRIRIR
jgi:DNA-binding response OmpR family regulator